MQRGKHLSRGTSVLLSRTENTFPRRLWASHADNFLLKTQTGAYTRSTNRRTYSAFVANLPTFFFLEVAASWNPPPPPGQQVCNFLPKPSHLPQPFRLPL